MASTQNTTEVVVAVAVLAARTMCALTPAPRPVADTLVRMPHRRRRISLEEGLAQRALRGVLSDARLPRADANRAEQVVVAFGARRAASGAAASSMPGSSGASSCSLVQIRLSRLSSAIS